MKVSGRKTTSLKIKSNILFVLLFILVSPMLGCNSNDFSQNKGNGIMKVKLVSLEKCSATDLTIALINEVVGETGVEIDFEHVIVQTTEDAIKHRHLGSPTVQVNGLDIDPGARTINQFGIT
jgi:hypothetical protein